MALASKFYTGLSAIAGGVFAVQSMLGAAPAKAENINQVGYEPPVVTEQMRNDELRQLSAARNAAGDFAESCRKCVGIVFNMGDNFRERVHNDALDYFNKKGIEASEENLDKATKVIEQHYIDYYTNHYAELFEPLGIQTEMHPIVSYASGNKVINSSVNFHIGTIIYETEEGLAYIPLKRSDLEAARVSEALDYVWERIDDGQEISMADSEIELAQN